MYLSWVSNLNKKINLFIVTTYSICMSFFSFAQSGHRAPNVPPIPDLRVEMPALPENVATDNAKDGAFQFAYPFEVSISKNDIQPIAKNDTLYYNVYIHSQGAYSLNLIFEDVHFPNNASLSLSGSDSTYIIMYGAADVKHSSVLPTPLIDGDEVHITYAEPKNQAEGTWRIVQVAHDFTGILKKSELKSSSSQCNVDINCPDGKDWQVEKRAVCKMLIQGITVCTGTLMNNTAQDQTPYILTANHCVASDKKAERTVFYFDYENATCGKDSSVSSEKTISGSTLVATSPDGKLDFSLLKLNAAPPESYNIYYAGWSRSDEVGKGTACIHHPKGDVKKISVANEKPTTVNFKTSAFTYAPDGHWKISRWNVGTTEGGSSGSPLFCNEHLVIGDLSGGEATCETPTNDFFQKFSKAWDYYDTEAAQLKPWLDPMNSGVEKCSGYDPYMLPSHVLTHVNITDSISLFDFAGKVSGVWTGNNDIGWTAVAEKFYTKKTIYDVVLCGKIDQSQDLADITFVIWEGEERPEHVVFFTSFVETMIQDSATVYVKLDSPISSDKFLWIGYTIRNNSTAFAAYQTDENSMGDATLFVKHGKGWTNAKELGFSSHLAALLHVTDNLDDVADGYEPPFFKTRIRKTVANKYSKELFAIDSIGNITSQTQYLLLNTPTVSNLSGPNEIYTDCLANKALLPGPTIIRSLKLGVAEIPSRDVQTKVVLWNANFRVLTEKLISNADLKSDYYNQIHFDSLIVVDTMFYYGVCYDSSQYEGNISLYQYYDVESHVDGYYHFDDMWVSCAEMAIPYNIALQPVTVYSPYHYNKDSARIVYYPILNTNSVSLQTNDSFIAFPSPCFDKLSLRFSPNVYPSAVIHVVTDGGHIVKTIPCKSIGGTFTIDVSDLPVGIFMLRVEVAGRKYVGKFSHIHL